MLVNLMLWRADMMEGIVRIDANCVIARCSASAAMVYGIDGPTMTGMELNALIPDVEPGTTLADFMVDRRTAVRCRDI
jgi:hypothetical protein